MSLQPQSLPTVHVTIRTVDFSDGTSVEIGPTNIVIVVGPNNAGKSATLRGIHNKLRNSSVSNPVVTSVQFERLGTEENLLEWLGQRSYRQDQGHLEEFLLYGINLYRSTVHIAWQKNFQGLDKLARWFCHRLTAEERLAICVSPDNIDFLKESPKHPYHFLARDDGLEKRLSDKFRRAFGVDLILHRTAGSKLRLYAGERPKMEEGEDRISRGYINRLEQLDLIEKQGDGMRSFAGVLLATSVGQEVIMLIDEPEAFLHPAQARLLETV